MAFSPEAYENAELIVPAESKEAFEEDPVWQNFKNLTSGVTAITANTADEIARYSLDGKPVDQDYRGAVIIVYSNNKTKKIINK